MATFLIGIDDTDNQTSPGTGPLARRLALEIQQRGAKLLGITRHQFLVDDHIPLTAQNRGACLAFDWTGSISEVQFAADLITNWSAEGSNPGICIAAADKVSDDVIQSGWAATREVLSQNDAIALARMHNLHLQPLAGSGGGVIGALASVGLRAGGNHGWFHDLPGLRSLPDIVQIHDLTNIGIRVEHCAPRGIGAAQPNNHQLSYKTSNWVRPLLIDGQPVWRVEWSQDEHAWIPIDRKRSRPLE